ncbi:MAG: hypothetical protein JSU81_07460 [Candidatus Coatesbacteria bacterium]|nr:MAG: hypothetical protein JSU81_07460 [Candidatus Coatesbacteria bacterium]
MTEAGEKEATGGEAVWEREVLAPHRWGRHGNAAGEELARLRELREAAGPLSANAEAIIAQIAALEICNWNLGHSFLALCGAVGAGRPAELPIGHLASVNDERWREVWAYYLTLRQWLPSGGRSGDEALLRTCDPGGAIQKHVRGLLGEPDELKELYVERLCLYLQFWLAGFLPEGSPPRETYNVVAAYVETKIRERGPEGLPLDVFDVEGAGGWGPCHHKAFRRYDVILSSVGAGEWRGAMPRRGTDGLERAALLDEYLGPLEAWIAGAEAAPENDPGREIYDLLGERDDVKVFLASLLSSLLRAQQLYARELAEQRMKEKPR